MKFSMVAAGLAGVLLAGAAQAAESVATPGNLQGWSASDIRATGTVGITGTYKPAGETGSLQFTGAGSADKANYVHALSGTLGDLVNNTGAALSYDYFVDASSTTAAHLAPALRLVFFDDATSMSGYLIYEPVYNGVTDVTNGAFVTNNILGANFWMRTFAPGFTVEKYDYTLADWAGGATAPGSYVLSAATRIIGVEVGTGSGWAGTFSGAVDHVNVDFARAGTTGVSTNFELAAGGVPEPASWALMIGGFAMAGAALRRRRALTAH
jgi:hypothetical protein